MQYITTYHNDFTIYNNITIMDRLGSASGKTGLWAGRYIYSIYINRLDLFILYIIIDWALLLEGRKGGGRPVWARPGHSALRPLFKLRIFEFGV